MKYKLDFYTEYKQFYLADKDSIEDTASEAFWTKEAHDDRLAIKKDFLGIGIECFGPVKGEIEILDKLNDKFDREQFDHIVEGSIEINSGVLLVLDCPNSNVELEINLKPGIYCVRIYSSNLASVKGDQGEDFYKVEICPGTTMKRKVIKRYENQNKKGGHN